jgi:dipeptidyl aminopeptidase/acylaminoacyl peptidase
MGYFPLKKSIEPGDFTVYKSLSRPNLSADGKQVVFSLHQANKSDNEYNSDIVFADTEGSKITRLTYQGKDSSPKFSPDSNSILFLSRRTLAKDEKGNELYIMSLSDRQPKRVLKRSEAIESPSFSPDSKSIYFLSRAVLSEEEKDDPKVVKTVPLWFNGLGFVYNSRRHLFSVNLETGDVNQITSGDYDLVGFRISNDGKRIGYLTSLDHTRSFIKNLFVFDRNNPSDVVKLTGSNMGVSDFDWSPDDSMIAINMRDVTKGMSVNPRILTLSSKDGSNMTKLEDADLGKGNSLNSDVRASEGSSIVWDGGYIYYLQEDGGSVRVFRVKPGSSSELVVPGEVSVDGFDVRNGKLAIVTMDSHHLEELTIVENAKEKRITGFNDHVYSEYEIVAPQRFSFKASDGKEIDCWVLASGKNQKLPTIVYVHGGPKTAFGNSYMHEFQVFASRGYALIYSNLRGSSGYSSEFSDIRGHYGERDYKDLLEMIEYATSKFPFLDKDRLAIAGGSYGGFMTNWAIGHTNIFKAAVADRSISSWRSSFWAADMPDVAKDQIGDPYTEEEALERMSPLNYVRNITTPLLIVHSLEDYRCPVTEGVQLYSALKYLGRTTEMVLFPGENHDLSRNGKPKHRIARLDHYLRWFDQYLKDNKN